MVYPLSTAELNTSPSHLPRAEAIREEQTTHAEAELQRIRPDITGVSPFLKR